MNPLKVCLNMLLCGHLLTEGQSTQPFIKYVIFPVCLLYFCKSGVLRGKSYTKATASGCGGKVKTADPRKVTDAHY